jgi:inosose dehydratase
MKSLYSRRRFVGALAAGAAAAAHPSLAFGGTAAQDIRFGYASITWGNEERQAITDIAALGFPGIQLRNNAVTEFKPDELRALLAQNKLTLVALSSGEVDIDPSAEAGQIAFHVANARYVHDAGGLYLQVLDQLKPYPRTVSPEECTRLGKLLTEIGKRTSDLGVRLGYHNHMNTIGEKPENLRRVLDAADPRYVGLELDTAHWIAGGGDPAKAILDYHDRLLFLHLKDVVDMPMDTPKAKYPFKFVELGKGRANLPAVFDALRQVRYRGWAVIELDKVPDRSMTPKECAAISKDYLQKKIGVTI